MAKEKKIYLLKANDIVRWLYFKVITEVMNEHRPQPKLVRFEEVTTVRVVDLKKSAKTSVIKDYKIDPSGRKSEVKHIRLKRLVTSFWESLKNCFTSESSGEQTFVYRAEDIIM